MKREQESGEEVTIEGTITKIVFEKDRFRIAKLKLDKGPSLSVLGEFPLVGEGARVRVTGKKSRNQYGEQVKASSVLEIAPNSLHGLVLYLSGGTFPGVGKVTAQRLVDKFGEQSLDVLTSRSHLLSEVEGISGKALKSLQEGWKKRKGIHDLMVFMREAGLGQSLAENIFDKYGKDAMTVVRKEPYRLAREVARVGFLTADRLGAHVGIAKNSPERVNAALLYALETAQEERGDTAFTSKMLSIRTLNLLGGEEGVEGFERLFESGLASLLADKCMVTEMFEGETFYYLPGTQEVEKSLSDRIWDIGHTPPNEAVFREDAEAAIDAFEEMSGFRLGDLQKEAVVAAAESSILVITGGPGTGKTTILKAILHAFKEVGLRTALASPTGRAAKRMQEATGQHAQTIHRLLRYSPEAQAFRCCRSVPISEPCKECNGSGKERDEMTGQREDCAVCNGTGCGEPFDVIIIDEVSMLDLYLAEKLIDAIPDGARLILVGDVDQLPSVGPGCVLRDVIESGVAPVVRLDHIYRQSNESLIKYNAHRILKEEMPESDPNRDFVMLSGHNSAGAKRKVVELVERIQKKGFKAGDIQVLVPQHKGEAGNVELNVALQESMNPARGKGMEHFRKGTIYRPGDRVMHLKNNYELGVFNGEVGYVARANKDGIVVVYEDPQESREVIYEDDDLDQLKLSYASTIHKCVSPDTLVETAEGLLPISKIGKRGFIASAFGEKLYRNFTVRPLGEMLEIVTKDGYSLKVSPEHGLDVWNGSEFVRGEARILMLGDMLRLRLGAVCEPPSLVLFAKPPAQDVRAKHYKYPVHLDEESAELFGLMVADGTLFKLGFRLVKRHSEVTDRFSELAQNIFGISPRPVKIKNAFGWEFCSREVADWLRQVGGMDPENKGVPEAVLRSSSKYHEAFLRGLFEDGSVHLNPKGEFDHIEWTSCYPELVQTVRTMLLRLGIICGTTRSRQRSVIYIYGESACQFRERIGFISQLKRDRLALARSTEIRYSIPLSSADLDVLRTLPKVALSGADFNNVRMRRSMTRSKAKLVLKSLKGGASSEGRELLEERLKFHYSPIESIRMTNDVSMCVEVPDGHRFLQNGFSGWNSQGSEYPAVIVVLLSEAHWMLNRNLVYTAITRGQKLVVVVTDSDARAMKWAISRKGADRTTTLCNRIRRIDASS